MWYSKYVIKEHNTKCQTTELCKLIHRIYPKFNNANVLKMFLFAIYLYIMTQTTNSLDEWRIQVFPKTHKNNRNLNI